MSSNDTEIVTCTVRAELFDWFEKLIKESCGPDVIIRCIPDGGHFNTDKFVEISGSSHQIIKAADSIKNIYEVQRYKMPWLKGNTYYALDDEDEERVSVKLQKIIDPDNDSHYMCSDYSMFGFWCTLYNFRPDLDHTIMLEIEEIFKSFSDFSPAFISFPNSSVAQNHSSDVSTTVLTAFHGKFLSYLSLEDILSLEIANGGPDPSLCYDRSLNHDIQNYLEEHFSLLYKGGPNKTWSFNDFRHREVLWHCIHKYHHQVKKMSIPNILPIGKIQSLSQSFNIKLFHNNITHIDFKTNGPKNLETDYFCATYHYDVKNLEFFNYNSKYAIDHFTINFNADDSLDDLNCSKKLSEFVIKCQNNCSPQKTNSILKWVVKHFNVVAKESNLVLLEFDLSLVPNNILQTLLKMMCEGQIEFQNMRFQFNTFLAILAHSNGNQIVFRKCVIASDYVDKVLNDSKLCSLHFIDMDVELNIICMLQNIDMVQIMNCHILSTSLHKFYIIMEIPQSIWFTHTSFDVMTLIRIMYCLRIAGNIEFISCILTPSILVDAGVNNFKVTSEFLFTNIDFKLQEIFEIFKLCQFKKIIIFDNCLFRLDDVAASNKFTMKPVRVSLHNTKLGCQVLLTILATLNHQSKVRIVDSCILHTAPISNISTRLIQLEYIEFSNCRLEMQTLLNILNKLSENTEVRIYSCDLLNSNVVLPNILMNLTKLRFYEMKLSLNDMFTILGILKENSSLILYKCEIDAGLAVLPKKNFQRHIAIQFQNMTIKENVNRLLLQTDLMINSSDFYLGDNNVLETPFNPNFSFINRGFDLSMEFEMLANTNSTSTITFQYCYLFMSTNAIPNFVLEPRMIIFESTRFDLDVLVTIMERTSHKTIVCFNVCDIQPKEVFSKLPIKISSIFLENMILEIKALLGLLKNCTNLSGLFFDKCEIVDSNSMEKIIPEPNESLLIICETLTTVQFKNVTYSAGFLQLCQHLTGGFAVEYYGQLSSQAIVELYNKTEVYGPRLTLMDQTSPKLLCFELFTEYFALDKLEPKTNGVFDTPKFIIPIIPALSLSSLNDLEELKIKFVATNDGTTKLEFLRDGKPIDLFFEVNDLPDDSEECTVDYY